MTDVEKQKALERAKEMFDSFDVDNDQHSAIIIMYDKEAGNFKMLTVNANPTTAMLLLTNAYESVIEGVKDMLSTDRTLN
jgi:D-alanine-D-alanine ligase-like ATP-grasp enzyme